MTNLPLNQKSWAPEDSISHSVLETITFKKYHRDSDTDITKLSLCIWYFFFYLKQHMHVKIVLVQISYTCNFKKSDFG